MVAWLQYLCSKGGLLSPEWLSKCSNMFGELLELRLGHQCARLVMIALWCLWSSHPLRGGVVDLLAFWSMSQIDLLAFYSISDIVQLHFPLIMQLLMPKEMPTGLVKTIDGSDQTIACRVAVRRVTDPKLTCLVEGRKVRLTLYVETKVQRISPKYKLNTESWRRKSSFFFFFSMEEGYI